MNQEAITAEYKAYIAALCRLASGYVASIRKQFALKAYKMYLNESVRRLVLEYGKEIEKLEKDRIRDFTYAVEEETVTDAYLEDSCLNKANSYADAIKFLFDI